MSKNLQTTASVMTIKEVAHLLNKDESTIRKLGKTLFPSHFKNGKKTYLTEIQVTAIKLKLGKNSELPKTKLEKSLLIRQAMGFLQEEIMELTAEVTVLKPKAELADAVLRNTDSHHSITDAGKLLGIAQKPFFAFLRSKKLLTQKRIPTQKALNMGILTAKVSRVNNMNFTQTVLTMENIQNFRVRYPKNIKRLAAGRQK